MHRGTEETRMRASNVRSRKKTVARKPAPRAKKAAPAKPRRAAPAKEPHVSSIMSKEVVTVRKGASVESVVELMLAHGLSRIPVVDENDRLIGVVSKTNLVAKSHEAGAAGEPLSPREALVAEQRGYHLQAEAATLEEVMSRSVMALSEDATLRRAAELMVGAQVHGLPVVTSSGRLVGFLSSMDIMAWISGLR
jgi:CBS domain-containing protein